MSHARVPRQPGVQVAHARLVHAEDEERRQAVHALLARALRAALRAAGVPGPARVGPRLLELVRQRVLRLGEHVGEVRRGRLAEDRERCALLGGAARLRAVSRRHLHAQRRRPHVAGHEVEHQEDRRAREQDGAAHGHGRIWPRRRATRARPTLR